MQVIIIETPSLGDRSYIVHDGTDALVIDPQRDLDRVLAGRWRRVTHVAETHLHNDYVSGGLGLVRMTGATYVHAKAEPLRFDYHAVGDGDRFQVGSLDVEVAHTPGHTGSAVSSPRPRARVPPTARSAPSLRSTSRSPSTTKTTSCSGWCPVSAPSPPTMPTWAH